MAANQLDPGAYKTARFFRGVRVGGDDSENGYLRATYYFGGRSGHLRISIWTEDTARCVVSIPEAEARRLVQWLAEVLKRDSLAPEPSDLEVGTGSDQ